MECSRLIKNKASVLFLCETGRSCSALVITSLFPKEQKEGSKKQRKTWKIQMAELTKEGQRPIIWQLSSENTLLQRKLYFHFVIIYTRFEWAIFSLTNIRLFQEQRFSCRKSVLLPTHGRHFVTLYKRNVCVPIWNTQCRYMLSELVSTRN